MATIALLRPLRHSTFALLWASYSFSVAATALVPTVVTLMILDESEGIGLLGIALAARTFGFIIGAVVGGALADRLPRGRVQAAASALRAVAIILIAVPLAYGIAKITVCLLLVGTGEGIFRSAYQANLADVLPADALRSANALSTLSMRVTLIVGPLLAVMIHAGMGARAGLLLAAGLWLASTMIASVLPPNVPNIGVGERNGTTFWSEYRVGLREALRHRWLMAGLGALVIWLGLGNAIQQLCLPVISRAYLSGDSFIGLALGVYAFGALIGAILLGSRSLSPVGLWAFAGLAIYGLVPFALYSHSPGFILVSYGLAGLGIECFNIPWFTAIQSEIPRHLLGRVSSVDFLVSYGISPLTLAVMPSVVAGIGQEPTLLGIGILVIGLPLFALLVPGALHLREPGIAKHTG